MFCPLHASFLYIFDRSTFHVHSNQNINRNMTLKQSDNNDKIFQYLSLNIDTTSSDGPDPFELKVESLRESLSEESFNLLISF